jgi:hypothetical protein
MGDEVSHKDTNRLRHHTHKKTPLSYLWQNESVCKSWLCAIIHLQINSPKSTEKAVTIGPARDIRMRPCAALLTWEPWRSDDEVLANSSKLRKNVCVRLRGAQDASFPAGRKGECRAQAQYHMTLPPKNVLKVHTLPLSQSRAGTDSREIQAAGRDRIAATEVDIIVFQDRNIVKTDENNSMSIDRHREAVRGWTC